MICPWSAHHFPIWYRRNKSPDQSSQTIDHMIAWNQPYATKQSPYSDITPPLRCIAPMHCLLARTMTVHPGIGKGTMSNTPMFLPVSNDLSLRTRCSRTLYQFDFWIGSFWPWLPHFFYSATHWFSGVKGRVIESSWW